MDGLNALDCAVGSLVWVQRRNGSWWPGQILSSDDVTGSHQQSSLPSGTPVKLLGREDAIIEWFNLEKSKRVKPFRCGEFDGLIERAEMAKGMPLKKREKYARREDGIIHALELERQMLKKQYKSGTGQMGAAFRAKRSRCVYLPAESSDSLDSSETASIDSETEPDNDEEMAIFSDTSHDDDAEEQESTSSEEPDELAISGDMPYLYRREPRILDEAVFKGKMNNHNLARRSIVAPDKRGVLYGADVEGQRSHLNNKRSGASFPYYRNDYSDAPDDSDQMFGSEDEYSLTPKGVAKGQNKTCHGVDWDEWPWEDQAALKGCWDFKGFAPFDSDRYHCDGRNGSMLVDVDIKVQTSNRKEPVPIVSVMSKIDGRSIIGHSIKIEALREGSTDNLFSAIDDFSNDAVGYEGKSVLPRAWATARITTRKRTTGRTARRTNFCIPRLHILSSNADEDLSLDQEKNIDYKKSNGGSSGHNASLWKKRGLNNAGPSMDKKTSEKSAKKVNPTSSKMTKPEVSGNTTVACIPVKLVFSRLLEKINRPALKAPTNADVLNTGVERRS
ncbi:Tudor/PWWP/MBT superfamily protein [Trifolium repens]|nr:Tudor/PWWP/MBT superfamily protein [Trifolium repens]